MTESRLYTLQRRLGILASLEVVVTPAGAICGGAMRPAFLKAWERCSRLQDFLVEGQPLGQSDLQWLVATERRVERLKAHTRPYEREAV